MAHAVPAGAQTRDAPTRHIYREVAGRGLSAYVFAPAPGVPRPRSAILLFHGGGWSAGEPEWTFGAARRFADRGLVAIAVEYRLSVDGVTPIDALADVCAAFRWGRRHADELDVRVDRVAGYGVSAGGHLVAAAATVGCPEEGAGAPRATPDALLLWSPALDLTTDGWFRRLLAGRGDPVDYSPAQHVGARTPPSSIVHGDEDTLTPLAGAKRFCDALLRLDVLCELNTYEGVGHLLTRNLANQESDFDPAPEAEADGIERQIGFLVALGFIEG